MSQSPLDNLRANPRNPRTITPEKAVMLRNSLEKFGDLGGIVVNVSPGSGQIVGGHQRIEAFRQATHVEEHIEKRYVKPTKTGTVAEGYLLVDGERFSYRHVHWDTHTEMAANISANKQAGEFDYAEVDKMLSVLKESNFDVDLTMFDAQDWKSIAPKTQTVDQSTLPDDFIDNGTAPVRTKLGDMFQLGNHRIICGSSTDRHCVNSLLSNQKCDITFTSPPYNAAKNSHMNGRVKGFEDKYSAGDDAMSDQDYLALLTDFTEIALASTDYVFVNLQLLAHNRIPLSHYQYHFSSRLKDILIWNKKQCPPNIVKGAFNTRWEYIFCFSEINKTRGFPCDWQGQYPNVVETESNSSNLFADDHRAGFPVALPAWFLEKFTFAKHIYEPFLGTGTTLCCAETFGRTCYGIDLNPAYIDITIDRWETLTGQKAIKM